MSSPTPPHSCFRNLLVAVSILLGLTACSRQEPKPAVLADPGAPAVDQAAKPPETQSRTYRALDGQRVISLVSADELEIREDGQNLVCKYTKQDGKMRVVVTAQGTTTAQYFNITPRGLVDEQGEVLYDQTAYLARVKMAPREVAQLFCELSAQGKLKEGVQYTTMPSRQALAIENKVDVRPDGTTFRFILVSEVVEPNTAVVKCQVEENGVLDADETITLALVRQDGLWLVDWDRLMANAERPQSTQDLRVATRQGIANIDTAIKMYEVMNGMFPDSIDALILWNAGNSVPLRIESVNDGWGNPIQYRKTSKTSYEIRSAGPDKALGTNDDLTN